MTTQNKPPARDPSNDDSLTGYTKELRRWLLKNLDHALPAVVLRHDRANNRVRVRPLITKIDSENQTIQRSEIQSIPVLNLGGGGFFVNFHLPVGQQGMIMALDRDISLFLQSNQESRPNTARMHAFNDSIFVPQQWFDYVIADEDSEAMVIQNLDGSVKIALDGNQIRIVNDQVRLEVNGDSVVGVAPGGFDLNGFRIESDGAASSPVSLASPSVVADNKELAGHDHDILSGSSAPGPTGENN